MYIVCICIGKYAVVCANVCMHDWVTEKSETHSFSQARPLYIYIYIYISKFAVKLLDQ